MPAETKVCSGCKKTLPANDFGLKSGGKYLNSECRPCRAERSRAWRKNNKERYREVKRNYRKNFPPTKEQARKAALKHHYGLTPSCYQSMVESQNNLCAICGSPEKQGRQLCVDHCHSTGKIRGLLCNGCNTSLGRFGDSISVLESAIRYLQGFNKK